MSENACIGIIHSVQEFIYEIKLLNMGIDTEHQLFYRGQNDSSYNLAPSVFRDGLLTYETKIFNDILVNCPEEFIAHKSPFEKLTKMQHYELPTRLLDITSNPLVALYFACLPRKIKKNVDAVIKEDLEWFAANTDIDGLKTRFSECSKAEDANGELFVWIDTPVPPDDPRVNVLAELAHCCKKGSSIESFTNEINRFTIENLTKDEVKSVLSQYNYITVVSSMDNNRIKRQSGAFILFGMVYNEFEDDLHANKNVGFHIRKNNIEITIASRNALVEKLKIAIAQGELPDISEDMKEYIEKQPLLNSQCSYAYIIPSDKKAQILSELDKLGINQKSLFPEIDRQAKYITASLEKQKITVKEISLLQAEIKDVLATKEDIAESQIGQFEEKKDRDKVIRSNATKLDTVVKSACSVLAFEEKTIKMIVADVSRASNLFSAPDWYTFSSQKASYRLFLKKLFMKYGADTNKAEIVAQQIVDKLSENEYTRQVEK